MLLTARFWKNAVVRAIKTAAQTAVALLGADAFNVLTADWKTTGAVAAGAAVASLLTSISQADEVLPRSVEAPAPVEPARDMPDPEPAAVIDEEVDNTEVL